MVLKEAERGCGLTFEILMLDYDTFLHSPLTNLCSHFSNNKIPSFLYEAVPLAEYVEEK